MVLIGLILAPLVPTYPIFGGLTLAFLLLLLPVTQGAVDLVNNTVTAIFKAYALPKLDFSKGRAAAVHYVSGHAYPADEGEAGTGALR